MADLPVIVGAGSRAWHSVPIARAALLHASGGRPAILRVGDAQGADAILREAAASLGWPRPDVKRAAWGRWCPACRATPSHRRRLGGRSWCPTAGLDRNTLVVEDGPPAVTAIALFAAALRNRGTLDCAGKLLTAGVPVACFCDECGPVSFITGPCVTHSLDEVRAEWDKRAARSRREREVRHG